MNTAQDNVRSMNSIASNVYWRTVAYEHSHDMHISTFGCVYGIGSILRALWPIERRLIGSVTCVHTPVVFCSTTRVL